MTSEGLNPVRGRKRSLSRRRALRLGIINGSLWAVGSGLTSGSVIQYLAHDLGADGLRLSLILAAPSFIGLLRILAPAAIETFGGAKRACLVLLSASYLLAAGLPAIGSIPREHALAALVALACTHQLLDYLGAVALWTWFGDLVPLRIRGRYFARRQMWQLILLLPTLLAGGYFADVWKQFHEQSARQDRLLGYAIPNGIGGACLLVSLVPLALIPAARFARCVQPTRFSWRGSCARSPIAGFVPCYRSAHGSPWRTD